MSHVDIEYRRQTRQRRGYLMLAAAYGLLCYVTAAHAQTWITVVVWGSVAIMLAQLAVNRSGALRISAGRIDIYRDDARLDSIPFTQIRAAQVRSGIFGNRECRLVLHDGRHTTLPSAALPPAQNLRALLAARGVPVI